MEKGSGTGMVRGRGTGTALVTPYTLLGYTQSSDWSRFVVFFASRVASFALRHCLCLCSCFFPAAKVEYGAHVRNNYSANTCVAYAIASGTSLALWLLKAQGSGWVSRGRPFLCWPFLCSTPPHRVQLRIAHFVAIFTLGMPFLGTYFAALLHPPTPLPAFAKSCQKLAMFFLACF